MVKSNNDPRVPAKLYLDIVQSLKGCPRIVRSDCGTENVTLAAIQCSLRATHQDEYAAERTTGMARLQQTNGLKVGDLS